MASGLTQWGVLTRRTLETLVRNRLTLAILVGSPALVVGMFAILFRPGAFDFQDPSPSSMVMIGFWVVFAAFFFGLTYGLLQICTERTILRRERLVGLRLGAYVASKVTVLVPFLLLVVVAMLGVLRLLDRLPSRPLSTYASMGVGLLLCAVAALGLGLLTSAMVGNVAQATLALPMLCFPAVLFSGAILPVNLMARAGAALSVVIPSRWAFEVIGHDLGARRILAEGGSPLGPPLLASYGDAGTQLHRHLLARPRRVRCRVPGRHLGCARAQHTEIDALNTAAPTEAVGSGDCLCALDLFRVTAARTRAFNASSSISSPSWKSMARLVFPSRLELKRPEGSFRAAPWRRSSSRRSCTSRRCRPIRRATTPERLSTSTPDDFGIGFPDQGTEPAEHLASPVVQLLDPRVYQLRRRLDLLRPALLHARLSSWVPRL